MELEELRRLVDQVRQRKMEPDAVEVKAAHVDTPKVYDSLSAFGNRPGGGVLLLGLDERQGFNVVGVGNTQRSSRISPTVLATRWSHHSTSCSRSTRSRD